MTTIVQQGMNQLQNIFRILGKNEWIRYSTGVMLNNHGCSETLYNTNIFDKVCFSLFISKVLGYGSTICFGKLIVLMNIIRKHSACGLNPLSVYIELSAYICNVYYNYVRNNDISTYGDYVSSSIYNTLFVLFMWIWGLEENKNSKKDKSKNASGEDKKHVLTYTHKFITLVGGCVFAALLYFCPPSYYGAILTYSIILNISSKVPQIVHNYNTKQLGVQSYTSSGIALVSSLVKLYIAFRETSHDNLLMLAVYSRTLLNACLFIQCIVYDASFQRMLTKQHKKIE